RIAVAGFQHETNSFVADTTDFATFASHRDRPPLVRGEEVLRWLGETSFALSGFLNDMRAGHTILPLLWTSGGAGGARPGRGLRAHRRRADRAPERRTPGRCRLSRPPRRHGEPAFRGWRGRTVAPGARRGRTRGADRHQPRLPRQRHADDGGDDRQPGRLP